MKFKTAALVASLGLGWGSFARAQIATSPPVPEWIRHAAGGANQPTFIRKTFDAKTPLLKAILLGACEGRMTVFLNGQAIGDIAGRERAAGFDVTKHIRSGENLLAIRAENGASAPIISILLELNGDFANQYWVASDTTWRASNIETQNWMQPEFTPKSWSAVQSAGRVDAQRGANPFDPQKAFDAYNSWKLALGTNAATDPSTFALLPGFKAELLRSALPAEGSWVGLAFDPKGRLTLAREKRGLIRLTIGRDRVQQVEVIDDTLLECRGLLYAYGSLYVNANNSKGFYRLRDTDGDDRFDEVKLLLRTGGGVGHGRNHVVLGPDGSIWLVHGNNVHLAENITTNSPLQRYQAGALIPCPFDDAMFDGDVLPPAGHILRTDPDGKKFELFAGAFRNPLDIAFNRDGEMFTFDADMEWDVGAPWYRPNRVNHVISGADFGWRRGTAKWPDYLPDTLPSTLDIGLASPTGVEFGTTSHFPPPYNDAFYIADWAYGRILAVHLKPKGASYTATSELFVTGRPLNVTDFTFGPDGAMYLITGGRGTQSGLYRISYVGPKVSPKEKTAEVLAEETKAKAARELRRKLEVFHQGGHGKSPEQVIQAIWPHLGDSDGAIRHAARVALEHQPPELWQDLTMTEENINVGLTAWLALARVGERSVQSRLLERLNQLSFSALNESQQLQALRTYELVCSRMRKPAAELAVALRDRFEALYPARDWRVNHRLCMLLVYLESPSVVPKTLDLLARADKSEDFMQYLFFLRYIRNGWTIEQRQAYLRALHRAEEQQGARDYYSVLTRVRDDFVASLTSVEREALQPLLARGQSSARNPSSVAPMQFVREWRIDDFNLQQPQRGRSFDGGKSAFTIAQCSLCHRCGSEGGIVGPDLTAVASRLDRRALLESIIEPSKVVDEKYRNIQFTLRDGRSVVGTVEREDERIVVVREGSFPEKPTELSKQSIARREPSQISPMPADLLNVLRREQILDLLAFLESGANANSIVFKP